MINRRSFLARAVGCALTALRTLEAAASSTVRVAFLRIVPPPKVNVEALEQGFRDLGYAPGRDILIEYRYANGRDDELRRLAADVVARKVDIILAAGYDAIRAAKIATNTIPIVMVVAGDPVGSGFVTSLARPGGNITGNSIINPTLAPKRLEVLKQVVPSLSRVATLLNKSNPSHQVEWKAACRRQSPGDSCAALRSAGSDGFRAGVRSDDRRALRSGGRTRRRGIQH